MAISFAYANPLPARWQLVFTMDGSEVARVGADECTIRAHGIELPPAAMGVTFDAFHAVCSDGVAHHFRLAEGASDVISVEALSRMREDMMRAVIRAAKRDDLRAWAKFRQERKARVSWPKRVLARKRVEDG